MSAWIIPIPKDNTNSYFTINDYFDVITVLVITLNIFHGPKIYRESVLKSITLFQVCIDF